MPQNHGLTQAQVEASRRAHGANRLTASPRRGFLRRFAANLGDPVIRILLGALGVKLLMLAQGGDIVETVGIAASVLLATLISTLSECGSEAAFARLQAAASARSCRVVRDGETREIDAADVVVGDVILLSAGEGIPADGRITAGAVTVDQSAMTGENREVKKAPGRSGNSPGDSSPADPTMLLSGTVLLSGSCTMTVTAVGDATALGGISREVQAETRPSPMKLRLSRLASTISRLGYAAAVCIALAYLINTFLIDSSFDPTLIRLKLTDLPYLGAHLLHAFTLALTVIVVAVPEGLPMMIAVVLSANMRRMVRDRVLVRRPTGIEAAGSMNLLFTDKTGTLTEGRMRVTHVISPGPASPQHLALHAAANADTSGGNATDRAIGLYVGRTKIAQASRTARIKDRLDFDSARKLSAAAITTQDGVLTLVKGAPDLLLPRAAMDAATRADLTAQLTAHADAGGRILLLAHADGDRIADLRRGVIPPLTVDCALVLRDPLRAAAKRAVSDLRGAGIGVVMITGDAPETARAVARSCGILGAGREVVLTGGELAALSDEKVAEMLDKLAVVSRALPSDKSRLVRIAQSRDLVVGMTGDGINDAPALRLSDVGFALGSGTEVAREAGDIILLEDDLAIVARAVLYGRNIFRSIRKFITLQLTMNLSAVGVSMICPFLGIDAPVTVVQMLWVNLIMDTLGGLAFAGEAAFPALMREPPKRRDAPILCPYMAHEIVLTGAFTVALSLAFLLHPAVTAQYRAAPDGIYHLTGFFAFFIFAGVLNCFGARTDRLNLFAGLAQNPAFCAIMTAVAAVQILFVYLGGDLLRTAPLTARELRIALGCAALVVPAELVRKLVWRWRHGGGGY